MTEVFIDILRKTSAREDPRLVRREEKKQVDLPQQQYDKLGVPISPKREFMSSTSPRDPRHREQGWQSHPQSNQYSSSLQTNYQHLPPPMYNEHGHYQATGYQGSYPGYQQSYGTTANNYNPYQGYDQTQSNYASGSVQPVPPGEDYSQSGWVSTGSYPNVNQPPPSHQAPTSSQAIPDKHDDHKKEAVAQELKQQKAQMGKQRDEYVRKVSVLRRELELLRNQKQELLAEHSPEHDNHHILRENNKLQIEIQNKMKSIYNVIEMLTNIMGDGFTMSELEERVKEDSPKQRKEKERAHSNSRRRSESVEKNDNEGKYNYVHYDPELHWCRICDVFPKSAKDLLTHLHSKEHREVTQERDMVDTPWHKLAPEPEMPFYEGAPKKRLPIKGLQFFISATSWYCKLCDHWIGDLHCASQHLKSRNHNQNYVNFVEQNPHWEIEWLKDREKALARTSKLKDSDSDNDNRSSREKRKKKYKNRRSASVSSKEKKKKKRSKKRKKHSSDSSSSSSSSDSSSDDDGNGNDKDKSKSIRVAMRNKMQLQAQMIMSEDLGGRWEVLGRLVEEERKRQEAATALAQPPPPEVTKEPAPEDNLISQWMTINEPQEKDKRLFNNLRDRMKQKQEAEKAKLAEMEQKRLKKEREERELKEKQEREERVAKEREEEKRRQMEELERIRDREREVVKFKTRDTKREYRKQPSPTVSPERSSRNKYSKSPSPDRKKHHDRNSERHRRDQHYSENGRRSPRRRSRSFERESPRRHKYEDKDADYHHDSESSKRDKRASYRRLPFIGRMPLFKNKKPDDNKVEKEIKKEDYDIPRQTRFQPGNLARSFIPAPDVVCFPKLSSIPPLSIPPPPQIILQAPAPPKISQDIPKLEAPPPPMININESSPENQDMEIEELIVPRAPPPPTPPIQHIKETGPKQPLPRDFQDALELIYPDPNHPEVNPATMMHHYQYAMDYNNMMYSQQMYDYTQDVPVEDAPAPPEDVPIEHTLPLPPPPLPPDDPNEDLAMLGISADDMAAQMF